MAKKHDVQARTADGDKPEVERKGQELTPDELLGKALPPPALSTRASLRLCSVCRKGLSPTDTFCPVCVPNAGNAAKFGGSNPPDPNETRTLAMSLPQGRFPHGGI